MTQQHPITPPLELVGQWSLESEAEHQLTAAYSLVSLLATKAARWGADMELEACCDWLDDTDCEDPQEVAQHLRAHRRPKPPSLRKQAYDALDTYIYGEPDPKDKERTYNTIRRALEALDD